MSVEPWIVACPRSAMMPPPGRPMFPSSSWRIEAVRMNCAPSECWVQPTAYAKHVVRSRPEFSVTERRRKSKSSGVMPQTSSTSSGV
jgi:hypothetical protein